MLELTDYSAQIEEFTDIVPLCEYASFGEPIIVSLSGVERIKYSPGSTFSVLISDFRDAMFLLLFWNDNIRTRKKVILENENNNKKHVLTSGNPKESSVVRLE